MGKSSLSGYTIYLRLLAMMGFDAIRPEYNCFISMIISVDTLCGFAPLDYHISRQTPTRMDRMRRWGFIHSLLYVRYIFLILKTH